MTWNDDQERMYHNLLQQAIVECECPYCGATYGQPCVTVKGRAPGTPYQDMVCHMGRVHGGHATLNDIGDPIMPREERICVRKP